MDVLTQYAWIVWLVLIVVFAAIEAFTLELTFLMLALGSVAGLVSGAFGTPWWAQFVVAAIVSASLILALRPLLLRLLRRDRPQRDRVDTMLGAEASVMQRVTPSAGRIRLQNGEIWEARLSPITEQVEVANGATALVTGVDGATAIVVSVERGAIPDV